ncbi:hypothetical protein SZ00_06235 (plasmid) [Rhodococcus sp. AD45]|nr:hypothetical protein SZ00_06235 [Rhodococcus sp. AD45]
MNEFHSLLEARVVIEDWKEDYNNRHRHSSLEYQTPNEYAASCIHTSLFSDTEWLTKRGPTMNPWVAFECCSL